ncbi:MAG: protein translocase subunit SecD [Clostridiales bacterium]|nr:protein translocase subunit SecD [Clostridiales bacterium]
MNVKNSIKLFLIVFIIAFVSYVALNGLPLWGPYEILPLGQQIRQGLDLKGGLYVVYEAKMESGDKDKDSKIDGAIRVIRNRLDKEGQNEATIAKQGENRIQVEIPGIKNPRELADILAKPAVLEFESPEGEIIITGKDVKTAVPAYGQGHTPIVDFELHPEGAKKFGEATTKYKGQIIKILLDKNPISTPVVNSAILGGKGIIEGMKDIDEAKRIANLIESGALPVDLEQAETRTIGATLGVNALNRAIQAGIIGIAAVLLFMLIFYRLPGLVADFALLVYMIIVMIVLAAAKITLTLPGIAGIILSVGMAVDANVIIFERIKEEIKSGKTIIASLDSGFNKAFRAILDSNITTLIAAFVLLYFGTGPIQGFAKTLIIGILASMFTAIAFTRFVLKLVLGLNLKNKWLYGA